MAKQTAGEFLAMLRKAHGYTQSEIAEKLNISDRTLSSWETDRTMPDLLLLPALADLYGVTVDEILRGERAEKSGNTISKNALIAARKNNYGKFISQSTLIAGIAIIGSFILLLTSVILPFTVSPLWLDILLGVFGGVSIAVSLVLLFYFEYRLRIKEGIILKEDLTQENKQLLLSSKRKIISFTLIISLILALVIFILVMELIFLWLYLLPFILLLRVLLRRYLRTPNNNYDSDSKPLRVFKRLLFYLSPVKPWCISFFAFIRERRGYWLSWLLLWLFYFNAYTIVIEFFAFYFYFTASFDVGSIYRQVYKLFVDLSPVLTFVPLWAWGIVALVLLDRFRKAIAYNRLQHYEMRNRGFINARPLVAMVVGTMGKGKTTMLTDMCLSTEVMFRDKAFEKLLENDLKFPHFPWLKFELTLRAAMARHEVYNLATCRRFVRTLRRFVPLCVGLDATCLKSIRRHLQYHRRTTVAPTALSLWGYDFARYSLTYDDKLAVVHLWDVLETYAQLYFIYITESSLLVANYSIRSDCLLQDLGNFPLWNSDFFRRDSRLIDSYSRHAHILDFDFLRLGKTVLKNNPHRHALEFGVVAVSEIGKERRNALELRERGVKSSDGDTNQKNDGFNDGLKMRRQAAIVDNFAFLKIISDEQRPESFGADARDMFDVIHIDDRSDDGLAMPFFSLGELLYSFVLGRFQAFYTEYRFCAGITRYLCTLLKALPQVSSIIIPVYTTVSTTTFCAFRSKAVCSMANTRTANISCVGKRFTVNVLPPIACRRFGKSVRSVPLSASAISANTRLQKLLGTS